MNTRKGFTLIELMVIIVIIGILAAVIAPRIPGWINKANAQKKVTELQKKGFSSDRIKEEVAKITEGDLVLVSKTAGDWFTIYKFNDKSNDCVVYVAKEFNHGYVAISVK